MIVDECSVTDSVEQKHGRYSKMKFLNTRTKTFVDAIELVIKSRTSAGKKRQSPYFEVTYRNGDVASISICKHGWRKAWKKALLCKTSMDGEKGKYLRFFNRPPKVSDFLV